MQPRPVFDGNLHNQAPFAEQEGSDETVHPLKRWQPQGQFTTEDPYRAAGISDGLPEYTVPLAVGNSAQDPLRPAVLTTGPPAKRRVVSVHGIPEPREILGPVL